MTFLEKYKAAKKKRQQTRLKSLRLPPLRILVRTSALCVGSSRGGNINPRKQWNV